MGKTLPGELVEVLDLVGVQWPNIDEDAIRDCAKDYRHLAEGIRDVVKEGNKACSHIVAGRSKGMTVNAIDRRWGKLTTKDLTTFAGPWTTWVTRWTTAPASSKAARSPASPNYP